MAEPIPMILHCPKCGTRHLDVGEFATKEHHTHSCQKCGLTWRPAVVPTVGVAFLPGFKNEGETEVEAAIRWEREECARIVEAFPATPLSQLNADLCAIARQIRARWRGHA